MGMFSWTFQIISQEINKQFWAYSNVTGLRLGEETKFKTFVRVQYFLDKTNQLPFKAISLNAVEQGSLAIFFRGSEFFWRYLEGLK